MHNEIAPTPLAALADLAAALDPGDFKAAVVSLHVRVPYVQVTSRRSVRMTERIYATNGWFWWSWRERMTTLDDVASAAAKIAAVLCVQQQ
jgi:hypothetical protein